MRVVINARYLQNTRSGIAQYLYYLLSSLKLINKNNEYVLLLGSDSVVGKDILNLGFLNDVSKFPTTNQMMKIFWQHFYIPQRLKSFKADIFHEPTFIAPILKVCPTVITIHDLAYRFLPYCFTLRNRLYLKQLMQRSITKSDKIIAVSENTKKDILLNYKIEERRIKVIYEGVDDVFRQIPEEEMINLDGVKAKYGIKKDFILTVSMISPRKNLINLIKSFNRLKLKHRLEHQLVVVGQKGWLFKEIFEEASSSSYSEDIIFCDFVNQNDLILLYNGSSVFVYPSLYEGFGLPLLEAMACGCPVVASNRASIPEVCSDAALLVDPLDPEAISNAVLKVLTDTSFRKLMIDKGKRRASIFSWKRTAEETLEIYKSLV